MFLMVRRAHAGVALRVHRAGKPRGGVVAAAGQRGGELLLGGVADDVVGQGVGRPCGVAAGQARSSPRAAITASPVQAGALGGGKKAGENRRAPSRRDRSARRSRRASSVIRSVQGQPPYPARPSGRRAGCRPWPPGVPACCGSASRWRRSARRARRPGGAWSAAPARPRQAEPKRRAEHLLPAETHGNSLANTLTTATGVQPTSTVFKLNTVEVGHRNRGSPRRRNLELRPRMVARRPGTRAGRVRELRDGGGERRAAWLSQQQAAEAVLEAGRWCGSWRYCGDKPSHVGYLAVPQTARRGKRAPGGRMKFGLLGVLQVDDEAGNPLPVSGARQRVCSRPC